MSRKISETTVRRLSLYLRFLERMEEEGTATASSGDLARLTGTTAAQVRKDLSVFGSFGKRGLGYPVPELAVHLREILGLDRDWRVALVGAGRIGSAIFDYGGFRQRGFDIVAVLDTSLELVGTRWGDVTVGHVDDIEGVIEAQGIDLVVVAVPAPAAQPVVDRAVAAGVRGVLNFAPARLRVPEGVALKNVNLVMEMETLSFAIRQGEDRA